MIQIIDDFLPIEEFMELKGRILSPNYLWQYMDYRDFEHDNHYQLVHMVYDDFHWFGDRWIYDKFLAKLNPVSLARMKTNCTIAESEVKPDQFHTDFKGKNHLTTCVYYINTNDGYTEFETGEKVESVENRLVKFPVYLKHRGSTSTVDRRVVLNVNYLETPEFDQS